MIWLAALIATAALVAVVLYVGGKPSMNRVRSMRDILRAFATLEVSGSEGALLFIEQRKSARFLQFRLDDTKDGRASISFGFPSKPWSAPWYGPMQSAVADAGFESSESVGSDGTRFLDVYDLTVPRAVALAQLALGVLEMTDLPSLRFHYEGPMGFADIGLYNERLREYERGAQYA